jgi:hypothetical protein
MFLGHFAVGLVASRLEPRLPLGTAFVAAQLPDAVWPYLLLAGLEKVTIAPGATAVTPLRFDHYPWSHSLVMVVVCGIVFMAGYGLLFRASKAAFWLLPLAVSHWVLDVISHVPDVPVLPRGGPLLGLGLWGSLAATLAVEGLLFAGAVVFFAHGRRLHPAFWVLIAFLVVVYAVSVFGPPPPSRAAIGWSMIPVVPALWFWGNRCGVRSAV